MRLLDFRRISFYTFHFFLMMYLLYYHSFPFCKITDKFTAVIFKRMPFSLFLLDNCAVLSCAQKVMQVQPPALIVVVRARRGLDEFWSKLPPLLMTLD